MRREFNSTNELAVRPFFRVIGALFLLAMSYLFIYMALPLFSVTHIPLSDCSHVRIKRRWQCEAGNWLNSHIPDSLQGPFIGMAHIAFALCVAFVAWLLLKPLLKKS